jgi:hypothetical protein
MLLMTETPRPPEPRPQENTDMPTKTVDVSIDGAEKTVEVPVPRKKTCQMKDVLPASIIPLIVANPKNDAIRSLMLAHLKQSVPLECDTFEKVKEWIEYNIVLPSIESALDRQIRINEEQRAIRARDSVQIAVRVEHTEVGRCSYSLERVGEGEIPLTRTELVEMASASDSESNFFERVNERLDEMEPLDYVSTNTVNDSETHNDHEEDDERNPPEVFFKPEGKEAIKSALRLADPELYRSIFRD